MCICEGGRGAEGEHTAFSAWAVSTLRVGAVSFYSYLAPQLCKAHNLYLVEISGMDWRQSTLGVEIVNQELSPDLSKSEAFELGPTNIRSPFLPFPFCRLP